MSIQLTKEEIQYNNNNRRLIQAVKSGYVEEVKHLIPISNPTVDKSLALLEAAIRGHAEIVELLIPVSNPQDNNSAALRWALYHKQIECVQLLVPVSDYTSVLKTYNEDSGLKLLQQCVEKYEALQLKECLTQTLHDVEISGKNSTKRKI